MGLCNRLQGAFFTAEQIMYYFFTNPIKEASSARSSTPAFSTFTHAPGVTIATWTMKTSWKEMCLLQNNDALSLEDEVQQFVIGNGRESGIEVTFLPVLF